MHLIRNNSGNLELNFALQVLFSTPPNAILNLSSICHFEVGMKDKKEIKSI